ncbi:sugar transferase [Actinomycetospora termitidis]|uniref:Sugar transferase n=1 Tax=Actinomycetospora termitidis TaxID=3053470 RepID=A0ABT7MEV2_9PSEU|nr:sugar transferase [Actinomycetospora sp. Odt1-22]MDL5159170.1 sugar transferase [Actinomycetospora sp. Odt1-22]
MRAREAGAETTADMHATVVGVAGDPLTAATGNVGIDAIRRRRMRWAWKVMLTDLAIVLAVGLVAASFVPTIVRTHPAVTAGLLAGLVALLGTAFALGRCWHPVMVSSGGLECSRIVASGTGALLVLALTEVALKDYRLQPYTLFVLPAAVLAVLAGRGVARAVLHRQRRRGLGLTNVLAVGSCESVTNLVERTRRAPEFGWTVVGACTPTGSGECAGVPVVGDLDEVAVAVHAVGAEVVAVAPAPGWSGKRLHRLAWQLEGTDRDLVVDPGLMEVAGPRLHMTPVDGLPMIRLTQPTFGGWGRVSKTVVDRLCAGLAVLLLAPVLVTLAILVKREDGGPVFFRQERVGREGSTFRMVKFRSMVTDAETARADLDNEAAGPLFKMRRDPRITRIGSVLRRYSLDELPQLFNVLGGSMSLVGPRPPLPAEVAQYADDARRRLLVRPGMTGLWQVSGRSDLSWDETVRLDLRYVENWSPGLDIHILARTVAAVVTGRGAY